MRAVVTITELMAGLHVIVEQTAVIDHAGQNIDAVLFRRTEHVLAGPGLEGIQDDHRPVHAITETLEALDHVEREAVRRSRRDAEAIGEALCFQRGEGVPDFFARVGDAVRVVQHEQVKLTRLATLQALFRRHFEVIVILVRPAQRGVGKTRVAFRALANAFVNIVPDDACEAVLLTRNAFKRLAQQRIGTAHAIHVRRDKRPHAFLKRITHELHVMLLRELFSIVHEASAAPGAVGCSCQVHKV